MATMKTTPFLLALCFTILTGSVWAASEAETNLDSNSKALYLINQRMTAISSRCDFLQGRVDGLQKDTDRLQVAFLLLCLFVVMSLVGLCFLAARGRVKSSLSRPVGARFNEPSAKD